MQSLTYWDSDYDSVAIENQSLRAEDLICVCKGSSKWRQNGQILSGNTRYRRLVALQTPLTLWALRVISSDFLLVISMLCKTELSWELRRWSDKLTCFTFYQLLLTTFVGMNRGNKWESNFDIRVKRVNVLTPFYQLQECTEWMSWSVNVDLFVCIFLLQAKQWSTL